MLLARSRAGARVLDSRTVLIVDEASTLGDRDLLALCEVAIETGATVRLIGDTAQHSSVATGGTFAELAERDDGRAPHLTTVHRLTDSAELERANLVRDGRASIAIDELVASGQLTLTDSDGATHAAMVGRWYEARAAGRPHPMVHGRNRERRLLNSMAQRLLVDDGIVVADDFVVLADGGDSASVTRSWRSMATGASSSTPIVRRGCATARPVESPPLASTWITGRATRSSSAPTPEPSRARAARSIGSGEASIFPTP